MILDLILTVVGLLGLVVAALSARIRRLPVSEPLLALATGVVIGPAVLGVLPVSPITAEPKILHDTTRILLAISVMGVALRYPLRDVRARVGPVALLLLVAMPLMALTSAGLAAGILGLSLSAALLLGTAVCPTDPVLASSVVTGEPAEQDLPARDRQLLSLESGANDGLALPLVFVAIAFATVATPALAGPDAAGDILLKAVWQVVGALVLGIAAGWLGGRVLRLGEAHGATAQGPMLLFTVVLALAVLGVSGLLSVDGVLAVFVAGLAFNLASTGAERTSDVTIDEAMNRFGVLPLFVYLGAALPWVEWQALGWPVLGLAVAVLFLRRLPVLLLLRRPLRLGWPDAVYLGWFGPVGVSALFYLALEAEKMDLPHSVLGAGALIVVASTVAHGVTAAPGRVLYRRAADRLPDMTESSRA
jgi:NhaP-type Na+/H+ or K+/H+ antiporter